MHTVARSPPGLTALRLILTGTAPAYGFEAVTTVTVFGAARGHAARSAMMWLPGSLGGAPWAQVPLAAVVVATGWVWLRRRAGTLDALAMGDGSSAALSAGRPVSDPGPLGRRAPCADAGIRRRRRVRCAPEESTGRCGVAS